MNHSITFDLRNTWTDWGLVPTGVPVVNPPNVRTEYLENPMQDGAIDYSESLYIQSAYDMNEYEYVSELYEDPDVPPEYRRGNVQYGWREGQWEFIIVRHELDTMAVYNIVAAYLSGIKRYVTLSDDMEHFYYGRVWVSDFVTEDHYSKIYISYKLNPFKAVNYADDHTGAAWQWNNLFNIPIFLGEFKIDEDKWKWRNLRNPTPRTLVPEVTTSLSFLIKTDKYEKIYMHDSDLILHPGDNIMAFKSSEDEGSGTIKLEYSLKGVSL